MAEVKWIKIDTSMFDNAKIKFIRTLPQGNDILLIWIMILVKAGKCNAGGYIFLTENIPYTDETLANELDMPPNVIKLAFETFKRLDMISKNEEGFTYITGWNEHQSAAKLDGIREYNRLKKQQQRAKLKLQSENVPEMSPTSQKCQTTEVEVDKEVDINTTASTKDQFVDNVDNSNYIGFFNNNMGHLMSPFEVQTLQSYVQDGIEPAVITMALQEAVDKDKKNMGYIKVILDRWLDHGIKTVQAVKADKRDWKDKKQQNGKAGKANFLKKESKFTSYPQRTYTHEQINDLEKKLLGG